MHTLYFSKSSRTWQNGGVGFIKTQPDDECYTLGYMYLITKEQFCDVVKQEINSKEIIDLNFESAIQRGNLIFKEDSWYGNLIYIGHEDRVPKFTFTNPTNLTTMRRPSPNYLKMIITGLLQTLQLNNMQIVEYLISKEGITGNYNADQLDEIVRAVQNNR